MDLLSLIVVQTINLLKKKKQKKESEWVLSRVQVFVTPGTVAHEPPLSMGFSRQEYWSWLPFPLPGDLPDPGMAPRSPAFQGDCLLLSHWGSPRKKKTSA